MPFAPTNDLNTCYEDRGTGPPIVLIHGGFLDRRMWRRQIDALSEHGRVITYDVRGHGDTSSDRRAHYSMHLLADDLKALLDELEVDRASLCGLSLGGMIAQTFAARYPQRVNGLVLVSTFVSADLSVRDRLIRYMCFPKWMVRLVLNVFSVRQLVDFSFWAARMARREDDWREEDAEAQRYVRDAMYRMSADEYWKIYEAIYDFRAKNLDAIEAPALVLCGGHEPQALRRHAKELDARIGHTHRGVIREAGHMAPMESPDVFNRMVVRFLRDTVWTKQPS